MRELRAHETDVRPLLVGEANPYGSDPDYALYPEPPNSAGGRLCRRVMGLSRREYIERFDRVNLCAGKWGMREARATAATIYRRGVDGDLNTIVLLGVKVCTAFDLPFKPFADFTNRCASHIVVLPHPSGLSRAWNAPGSYDRARAVLRAAGVLPA